MSAENKQWSRLARSYDPVKCGNIDGTSGEIHDKAIWRAVNSTYRPNKNVVGDKRNTLFIGRLSLKTGEDAIAEIFSKYGTIKKIRVVRDIVTGYSKGYAFIEYEDNASASTANRHADGINIDGATILVEYELERVLPGWIPRRLGGGFGGKKESGQLRFGGRDRPFKRPISEKPCVFRRDGSPSSRLDRKSKPYYDKRRRSRSKRRER